MRTWHVWLHSSSCFSLKHFRDHILPVELVLETAVSLLTESYRVPFKELLVESTGYLTQDIIKMLEDTLKPYPYFKASRFFFKKKYRVIKKEGNKVDAYYSAKNAFLGQLWGSSWPQHRDIWLSALRFLYLSFKMSFKCTFVSMENWLILDILNLLWIVGFTKGLLWTYLIPPKPS